MKKEQLSPEINDNALTLRFNNRDEDAFGEVYTILYKDLFYFASRLFQSSDLMPEDTLQDLFMKLWINKQHCFNSIEHIKAYMYTSIRNDFKEHFSHQKVKNKYQQMIKNDDNQMFSYIVETEVISELSRIPDLFPAECAKVLKLYLEGWDIKDIAKKLNKAPTTIYTQRQEIITILKRILDKHSYFLFLLYISTLNHK